MRTFETTLRHIITGAFLLFPFTFHLSPLHAQIGMQELGDSLTAWTGFSRVWSPPVRIKQMRVSGANVTLHTNATLKDVRWTPDNLAELKRKVSLWTLGHPNGKVTIYSSKTDIGTLVTECARLTAKRADNNGQTVKRAADLTDRQIVIYPSHGLYFNRDRQEWIWQRATLWTTVEDLYSQEYVRLIRQMLENAGATVLMPRAGLEQQQAGPSGMPQWTEGARYWLMTQGADSALWNLYDGNEYKDDMKCRAMWVNALNPAADLCLAFHTDGIDSGDDSTVIGTLAIYTEKDDDNHTVLRDGRDRAKTNRNLADWVQTQVTEDLRTIAPEWTRRQLKEANYCETRVPVVPSVILELLSHKNMADMKYGLDPNFRFTAARAVYKGILRYLNGPDATVQPLPVKELGINADGLLKWQAPADTLEPNAAPSYYMVYLQADGGEWDVQQVEKATQLQLNLKPGVRYNYYVVAANEGGLSFPSPVLSAYLNEKMVNDQMVLVVDAFNDSYGPEWFADSTYAGIVPDSYACENYFSCAYIGRQWDYTRANPWLNDDNCGWGACYRDHAGQITVGNTHDCAVLHGRVLRQMNISYTSCTAGMLQDLSDAQYRMLDIVCGRNRVPLTDDCRIQIKRLIDNGAKVMLSSDHFNAIDNAWAKQYFHASYYASHATHSGRVRGPEQKPYRLRMQPNEEQIFTPAPQALRPEADAVNWAKYEDMRCCAAVGTDKSLVFGFPLEAIREFDTLYRQAVEWLMKQ